MNEKILKFYQKGIRNVAKKIAQRDANTCCPFLSYQPKLPDSVKKMKKFKK